MNAVRVLCRALRRSWCGALLLVGALTAFGTPADAQTRPPAGDTRTVIGRVLRPGSASDTAMSPVPGLWVTVHRVGRDFQGALDSARTDAAGRYRIQWKPTGVADAVYFASVSYAGIAYFTPPLRNAMNEGSDTELSVFDTTTRTFPMSVRGRHLIVGAADSTDTRTVIEVFELSNDSTRALVSAEGETPSPTWSVVVPQAARDARANEGEISPDAFAFGQGRVSVFAPIPPGLKQLSFSYAVPASAFPLTFVAERGAVVFEVLVEEPQGVVKGEGFTAVDPVSLENRNFRRFLAQDLKPGSTLLVELPSSRRPSRNLYIAGLLVAIGFLMLLVLTRAMGRRTAQTAVETVAAHRARESSAPLHERLAAEIAALDATFARTEAPGDAVRAAYEARRAELKTALADALAEAPRRR